jgi:hypothetical protein
MPGIVEEGVREVMSIDAGASGARWNLAEWLYSGWLLPKIDNARPFVDLEFGPECRHKRRNEELGAPLLMRCWVLQSCRRVGEEVEVV